MRVDMVLEASGTERFGLNGLLRDTNVGHKLSGMVGTHKSTGLRGINQRLGIGRVVMIRNF
jgi:hypothetical protein